MSKLKIDCFVPVVCTSGTHNVRKREFSRLFGKEYNARRKFEEVDLLEVEVIFYYKNRCRADVDNLLKNLFDALEDCGAFKNDSQIKKVTASIEDENLLEGIALKIWWKGKRPQSDPENTAQNIGS